MRTTIEIDEELMARALSASGLRTKKAAVEAGLKLLIRVDGQTGVRRLRGKVRWSGDLGGRRAGRGQPTRKPGE